MARPSTNPILFNKVPRLDIRQLNRQGLIKPAHKASTSIVWRSDNGAMLLEVFVRVVTTNRPYAELMYEHCNERIKYRVYLEALRYGLGGRNWFFRCPRTNTRCCVLYLIDGFFFHRTAFKGIYETQVRSRHDRQVIRLIDKKNSAEQALACLNKKYFKRYYTWKGVRRPTRRYKKIMRILTESRKVKLSEIERGMVF